MRSARGYALKIPPGARCCVCDGAASRLLNLRMRRDDTGADWGPNLNGLYFCTVCATRGMEVEITVIPNTTGRTRITARCYGSVAERVVGAKEKHEQAVMFE